MATTTVFTTYGKGWAANRCKGQLTEAIYVGIGTDPATAAVGDQQLGTAVESKSQGTSSITTTTVTNDTYRVSATIQATAARAVAEACTFDGSSGTAVISSSFDVINLGSADTITVTADLKFA